MCVPKNSMSPVLTRFSQCNVNVCSNFSHACSPNEVVAVLRKWMLSSWYTCVCVNVEYIWIVCVCQFFCKRSRHDVVAVWRAHHVVAVSYLRSRCHLNISVSAVVMRFSRCYVNEVLAIDVYSVCVPMFPWVQCYWGPCSVAWMMFLRCSISYPHVYLCEMNLYCVCAPIFLWVQC